MTANELVAKIQEMNVDVGSADDVEKLKAAVGADGQSTEEFQELAWRALADCTASLFASKAKEMGLDLNNNDDVTKLCAELGETNLEYVDEDYQRRRYDLCAQCYQDYIKNPLGVEKSHRVGFSKN